MYISKLYRWSIQTCLLLWAGLNLTGCGDAEVAADETYVFRQPAHFPQATYTFENNPVTKDGFLLGRKLFYDPMLSRDGSVACGSCHLQATAFADGVQHPVSIGIDDRKGTRNAPALTNLAFVKEYFWDGGVTHLDFVPINALTADFEMDSELPELITKLNANDAYRAAFKAAFGIDEITTPYMLYALSQFMVMMVSDQSAYDQHLRGETALNAELLEGMQIFESKCGDCHSGVLQSDYTYRNNGLDAHALDSGRTRITENHNDWGKFRVPSLRNIALTAPYMHDGRFKTLAEVLEHYRAGVEASATLDPLLAAGGIAMTDEEASKIINFLQTLTDQSIRADSRFFSQQ